MAEAAMEVSGSGVPGSRARLAAANERSPLPAMPGVRAQMTCPTHPEKVRKPDILQALDGLLKRFAQPNSHIRRTYKCTACWGWHYTSKARVNIPSDPFPRKFLYGVVRDDDRRYWQSEDQVTAERYAKENGGTVVPFMESVVHHRERNRRFAKRAVADKVSPQ